jgi:hypothetical protein
MNSPTTFPATCPMCGPCASGARSLDGKGVLDRSHCVGGLSFFSVELLSWRQAGAERYFFKSACQLRTTVIGAADFGWT